MESANQPRVVIAGGRGYIGASLSKYLVSRGYEVVVLSRGDRSGVEGVRAAVWDARSLGAWAAELDGAAALVNLVGRTVDCIKTPEHCDEILRSRVESTRVLGAACRGVCRPPRVWVQMSTAHIYGDPPVARCDETSAFGYGLAPDVGRAWEAAFEVAVLPSQRGVVLRTSFVVGKPNSGGSGALGKLGLLARLGLGGRVGTGTQGMSWIHEVDMNRLFERAIVEPSMRGAYIASSPNPVSQVEFMRVLRRHAGGLGAMGIGLPAFEWMVRLGAPLVLRTDPELALYGRYVIPKRLLDEGFVFEVPELGMAVGQ
jgi:uncharacterized protein (TIGR01777 family)